MRTTRARMAHEVTCPNCRASIPAAADASSLSCPHCQAVVPLMEIAPQPVLLPFHNRIEPTTSRFQEDAPLGVPLSMRPCPHCGKVVAALCLFCPHCDEPLQLDQGSAAAAKAGTGEARRILLAWLGGSVLGCWAMVAADRAFRRDLWPGMLLALVLGILALAGCSYAALSDRAADRRPGRVVTWILAAAG